ncbi:uncharacterized protein LOC144159622 [Haemaphysalis longicornis]
MPSATNKKYEVPAAFSAASDGVALPAEELAAEEHRLWLIQTPSDVTLSNLDGVKISLRGSNEAVVQIGENSYEFTKKEGLKESQQLSVAVQEEAGEQVMLAPSSFAGMATLTKKAACPERLEVVSPSKRSRLDYSAHEAARQRFVPFGSGNVVTTGKRPKEKPEKSHKTKKSKK